MAYPYSFLGALLIGYANYNVFPNKYIKHGTYKSTPNQREEIKAYRDDNTRDLIRITAAGKKTVISFTTIDHISLEEKKEIQNFFALAEIDSEQRKVKIEYWNDEDNMYKVGEFYRPNMEFPIVEIDGSEIYYGELTIELVEY